MSTATVAAVAATEKIARGENVEAVLEIVIFAFYEGRLRLVGV